MMIALMETVEVIIKESKLYELSEGMDNKITDSSELDKPIAKRLPEGLPNDLPRDWTEELPTELPKDWEKDLPIDLPTHWPTDLPAKLPVIDRGMIGESQEGKEYKKVDEALEGASDEEKDIYENAGLEKGEVNGRESMQRTDINYDEKDELGRTNLERMEQGLAPLKDGKPIELHHIGQEMDAPLAELTKDEHMRNGNDTILHDKNKESEIDRSEFKKEKEQYWKARAEQVREERGE